MMHDEFAGVALRWRVALCANSAMRQSSRIRPRRHQGHVASWPGFEKATGFKPSDGRRASDKRRIEGGEAFDPPSGGFPDDDLIKSGILAESRADSCRRACGVPSSAARRSPNQHVEGIQADTARRQSIQYEGRRQHDLAQAVNQLGVTEAIKARWSETNGRGGLGVSWPR